MTITRDDEWCTAFQCGLDVLVVVGVGSDRANTQTPLDGLGDKRKGCDEEVHIFVRSINVPANFWIGQGTAYLGENSRRDNQFEGAFFQQACDDSP